MAIERRRASADDAGLLRTTGRFRPSACAAIPISLRHPENSQAMKMPVFLMYCGLLLDSLAL
jgi:hypothetical protein